jgi:mandelate racemase
MISQALTVRGIRAIGVEVPMQRPLGTSAATVRSAPLLLLDLETEEGVTGHAYQFCYVSAAAPAIAALLQEAFESIKGERVAPFELWAKLAKRFRLIGVQGIVRMAMALLDVACWDALARGAGLPLATLLGGSLSPRRAYNSNGLGLMPLPALADEAEQLLEGGFKAVKLRLGYPTPEADLAAVRAVKKRLPADIALMVDFNQALSLQQALERGRMLDGEGLYWIEEPLRHDDYASCARLAATLNTPIQIGENFSEAHSLAAALAAGACDYVMPDLERIGGVSGWLQASAIAAAAGIEMSSHLYPEVSAHCLAATPTAHWLEYVDWAAPLLREPLRIVDGFAQVAARPGNGLEWDEEAVTRYRVM